LITVQDQGQGIDAQDLERIFGRFERAVPSEHFGGLGLGLFITRQIAEACGGSVDVTSEPGQGSIFRIRLPVRRGRPPIDETHAGAPPAALTRSHISSGPILVVEDDYDIREALKMVLVENGYQVVSAGDGQEALDYLKQGAEPPALILLDLMMPLMNGFQFRAEQKKDPFWSKIPVIAMTAMSRQELSSKLGTTPVDGPPLDGLGYLQKPVDLQTLVNLVTRA
jgi:CheY-like chemotaxis protein